MTDPLKTVFISYRRNVSSYIARAIFLELRAHGYDVFMDVESIDSGQFDRIILSQIPARAHFVVICAPGTFENCDRPGDWLRREIETAMDKDRNIVPVMANEFKFESSKEYLTGKLAELSRYNGLLLVHEYFDEGMARLRDRYLNQPVYGEIEAAPPTEQAAAEEKIESAAALPAPTPEQLSAEGYFIRGLNRSEDDLVGKFADYSAAIVLDPKAAGAYYNRGVIRHLYQGDMAGAMEDYNQAIRYNPKIALAYSNRGAVRAIQGDLQGAMKDCNEAIRLDPEEAHAFTGRGFIRSDLGDIVGAVEDYSEAIRLDPKFAGAYTNRGEIYFETGRLQQAHLDFELGYRLQPYLNFAVAGLAITLYALGRISESQDHWRSLVKQDQRYMDAEWVRKELHWKENLVNEARKLIASL